MSQDILRRIEIVISDIIFNRVVTLRQDWKSLYDTKYNKLMVNFYFLNLKDKMDKL